jgi:DNA-binding transcriptional ArsR family regulator
MAQSRYCQRWLVREPFRGIAKSTEKRISSSWLDIIRYFAKLRTMNQVFKALSDPTRRQILHLLRTKPMTAGELAEHFSLAKPTLSGHFAVLREADLIEASKSGTVITYMLKVSVLEEAVLAFAEMMGIGLPTPMPLKKSTGKAK